MIDRPGSREFPPRALQFAAAVAAVYAVMGVAWILGSDAAVLALSSDPTWIEIAQRYKGLGYVLVTAVGLGVLIHRGVRRLIRANEATQSTELQVQDLFLNHPQPMWLYDKATLAFLEVNAAAVEHYGYSRSEFLQMTLEDIRSPEDIAQLHRLVNSPLPRRTQIGTVRHRDKSGRSIDVQITAHPLNHLGRAAVMVMAMDVTLELAAKRALERQEAQFRQLHESLGEVLWLGSADGRKLLYVSSACEQVYGLPAADFQRDPGLWLEMVHPDDRPLALASNVQLATGGHVCVEYRVRRTDGEERWIADRKTAILDETGHVQMIGGIAEDITSTKATEATLRRQAEELAQHNAELERFNRATVGRELDMVALKREVNELAARLGLAPPHALGFVDTTAPRALAATPNDE